MGARLRPLRIVAAVFFAAFVPFICAVFVAVFLATLPGCFHPDMPACAFSCVDPPASCPPGYSCEADGLCHDPQSQGSCDISPVDAGGGD